MPMEGACMEREMKCPICGTVNELTSYIVAHEAADTNGDGVACG